VRAVELRKGSVDREPSVHRYRFIPPGVRRLIAVAFAEADNIGALSFRPAQAAPHLLYYDALEDQVDPGQEIFAVVMVA